jgi:L-seryl-tRNA(Ser) seleniumtransferase
MQIPPFGFGPSEAFKQVSQWLGNPALNHAIKEAAQKLGINEVPSTASVQEILRQAGKWLEKAANPYFSDEAPATQRPLENGINATGELFNSRWTAQPLSPNACALAAYLHAGYSQDTQVAQELHKSLISASGAADALVIANIPTAIQLVVKAWLHNHPQANPQVILPRIACVRIPISGSPSGVQFRPLIDATGAHTIEIGSNSDCLHDDYAKATALHSHSLIFQATPIAAENDTFAAVEHAKSSQGTVCTLALDASLVDLQWSDSKTLSMTRLWDCGPDLIIAPTDYLLGGPQAAVILGKKDAIERVRIQAEQLGSYADRITQALLHCTLSESLQKDGWEKSPIGLILSTSIENLENRAQRIAIQLQGLQAIAKTEVTQQTLRIGTGPWQNLKLPSSVLKIYPSSMSVAKISESLAEHRPSIWTQVFSDHLAIVLRTVEPSDDARIVQALSSFEPQL